MINFTEELTCVICFELFQEPITLSCGHTFCKVCIKSVIDNTSKCPFCQCIIFSSNFQVNFVIQKLVKKLISDENPDRDNIITKRKQKKPEATPQIQKIISFNLLEHKYTFDGTLYKLKIEFKNSKKLFLEIMKELHFAAIHDKNQNLASIFKLEGIQMIQRGSIVLIARCQKRVKIESIENVNLTNSPFYIDNNLLRPHEYFEIKVLNYQYQIQLSNDLNEDQQLKLNNISNKVTMLFQKLKRNNIQDYEILKIRHQVNLIHTNELNIKYQDNLHKYIEFLSQLLNLSQNEKGQLFKGESLDQKLKIFLDFLDPVTEQNDPVFVFYITQNIHKDNQKPFFFLLIIIGLLFLRYFKNFEIQIIQVYIFKQRKCQLLRQLCSFVIFLYHQFFV